MTAVLAEPMTRAMGWELAYTGHDHNTKTEKGSDKFYRAFVLGGTVVFHFGRKGTAGQFKVQHSHSFDAARAHVLEMIGKKEEKGYRMSHGTVLFQVPTRIAQAAGTTDSRYRNGDPEASRQVVEAWQAKINQSA